MKDKPLRTPITDVQRQQVNLLATCTFQSGSYIKRFVRDIHAQAKQTDFEGLTPAQAALLEATYYHYRGQIGYYLETNRAEYPDPPAFTKPDPKPHTDAGTVIREEAPDWRELRRKAEAERKLMAWRKSVGGEGD
ncbi:MAG: hypothetical protein M0Z43_13515 [Acidithiobacillus sp.]|nr:hypothetical protein [Acidithiobacillus sp.]